MPELHPDSTTTGTTNPHLVDVAIEACAYAYPATYLGAIRIPHRPHLSPTPGPLTGYSLTLNDGVLGFIRHFSGLLLFLRLLHIVLACSRRPVGTGICMHGPLLRWAPSYMRPDGMYLSWDNFFLASSWPRERGSTEES
jgi:hypothetical protein